MQAVGLLVALFGVAAAQFGGSGGQCDYQNLERMAQQKMACLKDTKDMLRQAMREVQRYDPSCNEGGPELCEKCSPMAEQLQQGNDLDVNGIMECCFQGRLGNGNRQCEWKDKRAPGGHGHHGGHGGRGGHHGPPGRGGRGGRGRGGRGRGGPPGPPPPGMEGEEGQDPHEQMHTLGGMAFKSMDMMVHEMHKHLGFCENEMRPANQQAIDNAIRQWSDRLTAKVYSCYSPFMDVATNCTDVQPEDLKCLMGGFHWAHHMEEACYMVCGPDSLDVFCNAYTQAAQAAGNGRNGGFRNQRNNNDNSFNPFKFNNF